MNYCHQIKNQLELITYVYFFIIANYVKDEKVDVEECLIEIPQMINKTQASTTTIISMSPFAWALDTINTDLIRLFMDSPLILMNSGIAYVSKHQHKSQETKLDFNQPTKSFSSFFFSQQQEFSTTPPIIQYGSTHASYELTPLEYIIAFKLCPHLLYHLQGMLRRFLFHEF